MTLPKPSCNFVKPEPFVNLCFSIGNRRFYDIKNKIYEFSEEIDTEEREIEGYITDRCDYEGDLDEIVINNCPQSKKLIEAICEEWDLDIQEVGEQNIVLSIWPL